MSTTTSTPSPRVALTPRRELRILAVVGASVSALLVWFVGAKVIGTDLHQPAFGTGVPPSLPPFFAAGLAGLLALLGWGVLAVLEHFWERGGRIWLYVALVALVLSLGNPLSGHGVGLANRLALVVMHLVAGAIVIPLLYLSSSRRGLPPPERRAR